LEAVWLSLNKFFEEFLPSFEVAKKLMLRIDMQELVKACEGIIVFTKEGPYLAVPRNKLTDSETLQLVLLASYIGHKLGKVEKEEVSKDELRNKLGKDAKTLSARLGELVKNGLVARNSEEKYRITIFGLAELQKEIIPRVRAKMRI
jgi:hypothetical protein